MRQSWLEWGEDGKYCGTDALLHPDFVSCHAACALGQHLFSFSLIFSSTFAMGNFVISISSSPINFSHYVPLACSRLHIQYLCGLWASSLCALRCNCHQCHFHLGVLLFTLSSALKIQQDFNSLFCSQ